MENIVVLLPNGQLKVIRAEDYSDPENRLYGYVGPVGHDETIRKVEEIAMATVTPQKER